MKVGKWGIEAFAMLRVVGNHFSLLMDMSSNIFSIMAAFPRFWPLHLLNAISSVVGSLCSSLLQSQEKENDSLT